MADKAIEAIRDVALKDLSFQWFRSAFRADNGLKDTLYYGHAVIDSTEKLDQYLHTYGPMIESQWKCAAPCLDRISPPTVCIDYGCGQGLAGLLVSDISQGKLLKTARKVLLIEPSAVALARSTAIYKRIAPAARVTSICRRFDDLEKNDFPPMTSERTLHLFSNSLDVPAFDPQLLLGKTLQVGCQTILSVSHDRDFNGGTPRIARIKKALETMPNLTISESTLERFTCDNPNQSKGVVWLCEFEVRDG